jgi:hypothetical protein
MAPSRWDGVKTCAGRVVGEGEETLWRRERRGGGWAKSRRRMDKEPVRQRLGEGNGGSGLGAGRDMGSGREAIKDGRCLVGGVCFLPARLVDRVCPALPPLRPGFISFYFLLIGFTSFLFPSIPPPLRPGRSGIETNAPSNYTSRLFILGRLTAM